jgi:uncharacterized protein (TIGR02646 family)
MRKLIRRQLSPKTQTLLAKRTAKVLVQPDGDRRAAEAERLWQQRRNRAFREIREALEAMASGLGRCMYCEDSLGTDIEHFRPKRHYPAHAFEWTNYLLACSHCNSNEKRTQFPLDEHGQPLLIDPTADDPSEHLVLTPTTGRFGHLTRKGDESIKVFGLSRETLETGRKDTWHGLVFSLIPSYAEMRRQGDVEAAEGLLNCICRKPFSSVLGYLLRMARMPGAPKLLRADCLAALREFGDELAHAAGFTH